MTIQKITTILDLHSIHHMMTASGRLLAEEIWTEDGESFSRWIDVTEYSLKQLLDWLGY